MIDLAYATDARAEHRAADSGRRSERVRPMTSRSTSSRPASTRRCARPARRRCASSTSASTRAARATIPLASPATDIDLAPERRARLRGRSATRSSSRSSTSRATRRTRAASRPIDLTNATLGSLVLSRDGTRGLLLHERDARRAHHDGQARPARLPARDVAAQEVGARGRHLADRRHARSCSTRRRSAIRRPRRTVDDYIDKSYGYTLLDLATRLRQAADHAGRSGSVHVRARRLEGLRRARRWRRRDRDARAAGRHDADRRRDRRSRSARRRRRSASCRAPRRRSSRSAIRSAACRSSISRPTRSAPSPASTSTATSCN